MGEREGGERDSVSERGERRERERRGEERGKREIGEERGVRGGRNREREECIMIIRK